MRRIILNFHGLGEPKRTLEAGEARYWISPDLFDEAIERAAFLRNRVLTDFTFDDGNLSDLEIAAPRLASAGIKAQFFVLAGRLDQKGALGPADIKQLQRMGHGIGNHGLDHASWRSLDDAGLDRELLDARRMLEAVTETPIRSAAIPFGQYNARVIQALKKAGYDKAYSSDGGAAHANAYPNPRTSLTATMTGAEIENIILGRESATRTLRRNATMMLKRMI